MASNYTLYISGDLYRVGVRQITLNYPGSKGNTYSYDITATEKAQTVDLSKATGGADISSIDFYSDKGSTLINLDATAWQSENGEVSGANIAFYLTGGQNAAVLTAGTNKYGYLYKISSPTRAYYRADKAEYMTAPPAIINSRLYDDTAENPIGLTVLSVSTPITCTFDSQGGATTPTAQSGNSPLSVTEPTAPTKEDYIFDGWYTAASGGIKITFPYTITADTTLYAHWRDYYTATIIGTDSNGADLFRTEFYCQNVTRTGQTVRGFDMVFFDNCIEFHRWVSSSSNEFMYIYPYAHRKVLSFTLDGATYTSDVIIEKLLTADTTITLTDIVVEDNYVVVEPTEKIDASGTTKKVMIDASCIALYYDGDIAEYEETFLYKLNGSITDEWPSIEPLPENTIVYQPTTKIDGGAIKDMLIKADGIVAKDTNGTYYSLKRSGAAQFTNQLGGEIVTDTDFYLYRPQIKQADGTLIDVCIDGRFVYIEDSGNKYCAVCDGLMAWCKQF